MLELRPPHLEDEPSFRAAHEEFEREDGDFQFASGLNEASSYGEYIAKLARWSCGRDVPKQYVPGTFLIGVVDGVVVGRVSLRHRLSESLLKVGGHIGFGVIPSRRRKGYCTEMVRQTLPLCAPLGIERALITCDVDNTGSIKVIERNGGRHTGHQVLHGPGCWTQAGDKGTEENN